jgi:hypothetical protein
MQCSGQPSWQQLAGCSGSSLQAAFSKTHDADVRLIAESSDHVGKK